MKRSEIVVGGKYEGCGGRVRDVMAEGPEFVAYPSQEDRDCIQWGGKNATGGTCTRTAFAAWAKSRIGTIQVEKKGGK